jgi:hypothetical protein
VLLQAAMERSLLDDTKGRSKRLDQIRVDRNELMRHDPKGASPSNPSVTATDEVPRPAT